MKEIVVLSPDEIERGRAIGSQRQNSRVKAGSVHRNNLKNDYNRDLRRHIEAVHSEMAAQKYMGEWCKWDSTVYPGGITNHADLQDFIDVKLVSDERRRLIVPVPTLNKAFAYLLLVGKAPSFWIRGWVWGSEMSNIQELQKGRPCYVVEHKDLRQPRELKMLADPQNAPLKQKALGLMLPHFPGAKIVSISDATVQDEEDPQQDAPSISAPTPKLPKFLQAAKRPASP